MKQLAWHEVEKEERPVYFISWVLHSAEVCYQVIEKVPLTARRMQMYFQKHHIVVKTDYPNMKILVKLDLVGRIAVELSEFHIQYEPRGVIKSQTLVNLMVELNLKPIEDESLQWILHVDCSSKYKSCGAGVSLNARAVSSLNNHWSLTLEHQTIRQNMKPSWSGLL